MKYLSGVFLLLAFMMSNTTFAQKKPLPAKKMAKKMCKCMDPLMGMMEKAQNMSEETDEAALMAFMQEMEEKGKEFDECMGGMQAFEESMAALPEEEAQQYEKDLEEAMKKFCPETIKFFEQESPSEPSSEPNFTEPKRAD